MTYLRTTAGALSAAALLGACLVACASRSQAAGPHADGVQRLIAASPGVIWGEVLEVNLDGDALVDRVVLGRTSEAAVVGVALGKESNALFTFRVPTSSGAQLSICAQPSASRIIIEPRAQPSDPDAPPEAKVSVRGAQGFRLESGECDSIHFYFDGTTVKWWRR